MLQLLLIKHTFEVDSPCGPVCPVINAVRSGKAAGARNANEKRLALFLAHSVSVSSNLLDFTVKILHESSRPAGYSKGVA